MTEQTTTMIEEATAGTFAIFNDGRKRTYCRESELERGIIAEDGEFTQDEDGDDLHFSYFVDSNEVEAYAHIDDIEFRDLCKVRETVQENGCFKSWQVVYVDECGDLWVNVSDNCSYNNDNKIVELDEKIEDISELADDLSDYFEYL